MWLWMSVCSACLLGIYDVAKKQALKKNSVLGVLLAATALSTLFLTPFFSEGSLDQHLTLMLKAVLVTTSWVSGMIALKLLPITTSSTIKASRPVLVVIFSIILFGERLNWMQWGGVVLAIAAIYMLSRSSKSEGIDWAHSKGILWMGVSVLSGAASALYDKHILKGLEPLFVQSWGNLYITILLALIIAVKWFAAPADRSAFKWDWTILLIAAFITISDCLYFFALKDEGALLSVISLIRRSSVVITFVLGALLFKENKIMAKAGSLAILLAGMVLLMLGSSIIG